MKRDWNQVANELAKWSHAQAPVYATELLENDCKFLIDEYSTLFL